MKTKVILEKMDELVNVDSSDALPKKKSLESVLEKLVQKEEKLTRKLENASDEKRIRIHRKLKNLHAQRKKGERLLARISALSSKS